MTGHALGGTPKVEKNSGDTLSMDAGRPCPRLCVSRRTSLIGATLKGARLSHARDCTPGTWRMP